MLVGPELAILVPGGSFSVLLGPKLAILCPGGSFSALVGPEDVVLVLVSTPVLVGSGFSASAVLCESGSGIDLPDEKKEGSPKDIARLFRRMGSLDRSALFMKGLHCSARNFRFISLPIQG